MASIVQRGKSFNVVYYYTDKEGKRKQKWETFQSIEEAKTRCQNVDQTLKYGSVNPLCKNLKELLEEYVDIYGRSIWSLSTYQRNLSLIDNYILPLIGNTNLADINSLFLEKYYQTLLKTPVVRNIAGRNGEKSEEFVGTGTIRNIHRLFTSCFKQAVKWDLMDKNPAVLASVPKHKTKKRQIWTAETLMYAIDVCENEKLKMALNLAFTCSLRIGELLGLTWDCVDISEEAIAENRAYVYINKEYQRPTKKAMQALDKRDVITEFPSEHKRSVSVRVLKTPKTESSIRKVFLPNSVAKELIEWKKRQDEEKEFMGDEYHDYGLVMANGYGYPVCHNLIGKLMKDLIKKHDLPEVVFHSIRHTSVTYKLKLNGGDIKAVQGDSGHAEVSMVTDVYSHIIDEDRRKNAILFEEAFYQKKDPNPKMNDSPKEEMVAIPKGVDPELLEKIFRNPELLTLLESMAKTIG